MGLETIAPPRVQPGDTVAIVSPSAPAVARWPHRVERGITYLESLGLRTKVMPNAGRAEGWVSASPEARAEDIHAAFADDDVAVVLASIGGNHSNQILPHLDFDLIASHPKIFQGFSDMTVLAWAFVTKSNVRAFYGPALVSELGEYPEVPAFTDRYLRSAWMGDEPLAYEPVEEWTDEFLDWDTQRDLARARKTNPGEGWITIRGGVAEGPILGGCLETLCWHLKGTDYWLDFDDAIFFFETSEEAPSPEHVDAYLTDLELLGVFDRAAGLMVGRPFGYDAAAREQLWKVVAKRTEPAGIPVLGNVDCGHTDPMITIPLGAPARLDASEVKFEILEPATSPR